MFQFRIAAYQVSHQYRFQKLEFVYGDRGDTPLRNLYGEDAPCNVYLGHQPATEHVACGIGIGRHRQGAKHQLPPRQWFGLVVGHRLQPRCPGGTPASAVSDIDQALMAAIGSTYS